MASISLAKNCFPMFFMKLILSFCILGLKLIFVTGLEKFDTAVARVICPYLLGPCLSCFENIYFGPVYLSPSSHTDSEPGEVAEEEDEDDGDEDQRRLLLPPPDVQLTATHGGHRHPR